MNFAYDAIWWKLKNQYVRDLACLLVSPVLWNSSKELPIKYLLGENGFRYLLYINENPQILSDFINNSNFNNFNEYAKILLNFWFINSPHCNLIEKNIPIKDEANNTITIIDFITEINNDIYHIECDYQYYENKYALENQMKSINNNEDSLINKINNLNYKLQISNNKYFKKYLFNLFGKEIYNIKTASIIRGMVFFEENNSSWKYLNKYLWDGAYGLKNLNEKDKLAIIPKINCLAPIAVQENKLYYKNELNDKINFLVALVEKRADGIFHEVKRFFIK